MIAVDTDVVSRSHIAIGDETVSSIVRNMKRRAEHVDPIHVRGIHENLAVVHRPRVQIVDFRPALAPIARAVEPAFSLVLDESEHDVGIPTKNGDADAPERTFGESRIETDPTVATVHGFVETTPRPASVETPWGAPALVGRSVEHVGVDRIQRQRADASVFVDLENLFPAATAVERAEHTSLSSRAPQAPKGSDEHALGIGGIEHDFSDMPRINETLVRPRLACIDRLVHTVAETRALSIVGLAGADPNDLRVRRRNHNIANRGRRVLVEDGCPRRAVIDRFPQLTGRGSNVDRRRLAFDDRDRIYPSPHHRGSDRAKPQVIERLCGRKRE